MGIIEDGTLGHWDSGWESQLGTQSNSCRKFLQVILSYHTVLEAAHALEENSLCEKLPL